MADYQLHYLGTFIIRTRDGAQIPFDLLKGDYQAYLAWLDAGNTPDPADPPPAPDPQDALDRDALAAFIAAYPDMRTRLATIQTEMDGIKGRADTLAGLPTWNGLTLAVTTVRLQQVMPPLGQDLSTVASEVKAICIGLANMLQAVRIFVRQQGGG